MPGPRAMAAARWARRHGQTAILMSESQAIDRPPRLVERAGQSAAGAPLRRALVGGPAASRLPGRRWGCRPTASPWVTTRSITRIIGPSADCLARRSRGTARLARRAVLPVGLPLRPREEPAAPDQGIRPLPRPGRARRTAGTWSSAATGPRPARSTRRSSPAVMRTRSTGPASCRPILLRAGMLLHRLSSCPAFPSPGDWSSTRPPAPALPLLVSERAGCARRLFPSRRERPEPGSTRSTSKR